MLFLLNPLFIFLSIVPYQEGVLLIFIYSLLIALAKQRYFLSGLIFSLACLVRYEAWLFGPFILYFFLTKEEKFPKLSQLIIYLLPFTFGGIAWLGINYYQWNDAFHFLNIYHFLGYEIQETEYVKGLFKCTLFLFTYGTPLMFLAIWGAYAEWKTTRFKHRFLQIYIFWILFLFITQPYYVADYAGVHRHAFKMIAVLSIFLIPGINLLPLRPRLRQIFILLSTLGLCLVSTAYVYYVSNREIVKKTYDLAQTLEKTAKADERIIILSEGFPKFPDAEPIPYIRIGGQSDRGRAMLISAHRMEVHSKDDLEKYIQAQNIRYLLQYNDYEAWDEQDQLCFEKIRDQRQIELIKQMGDSKLYKLIW